MSLSFFISFFFASPFRTPIFLVWRVKKNGTIVHESDLPLQPAQMTSSSLPGILQGKSSWVPFHAILCSTCQVTSRLIYFDPTQSRDLESALRRRCNHGGSVLTLHAPPCSSSPRIRRSLQLGCSCRCPHAILTTLLSPI